MLTKTHRYLFTRSLVADGNFHADHIRMKKPEDDVKLADGSGYMVQNGPYLTHLASATTIKEVNHLCHVFWPETHVVQTSTCQNY
jgi:hypothetical protein